MTSSPAFFSTSRYPCRQSGDSRVQLAGSRGSYRRVVWHVTVDSGAPSVVSRPAAHVYVYQVWLLASGGLITELSGAAGGGPHTVRGPVRVSGDWWGWVANTHS